MKSISEYGTPNEQQQRTDALSDDVTREENHPVVVVESECRYRRYVFVVVMMMMIVSRLLPTWQMDSQLPHTAVGDCRHCCGGRAAAAADDDEADGWTTAFRVRRFGFSSAWG